MLQKNTMQNGNIFIFSQKHLPLILFISIGLLGYVAFAFAADDTSQPWPDENPTAEQLGLEFTHEPREKAAPSFTTRTRQTPALVQSFGSPWVHQGPGPAVNGQVENLSPDDEVTGAVHVVLPHPTNADILFAAGVNGGVWKTTNATAGSPSWSPLTDAMPSLSIGALEFDYNDSSYQTLVAGVGRFSSFGSDGSRRVGIYKSTDGGTTWMHLNGGGILNDKNISGVAARGDNILVSINFAVPFSCSNIGIFRSSNGGSNFTRLTRAVNGMPAGVVFDLEGHPNQPTTLYSAVNLADPCDSGVNGIYKSTDTGLTWSKVSDSAIDALIVDNATSNVEIAVYDDGQGANVVYAAILNFGQLINGGVFYSTDGGTTWTQMDVLQSNTPNPVGTNPRYKPDAGIPGGQGAIHFSIEPAPSSSQIVYVGGDRQPDAFEEGSGFGFPNSIGATDYSGRLFRGDRSQNSGSQWVHLTHVQNQSFVGGGTLSSSAPHADSREMAFDANGDLIQGDDGGIYRRTFPGNNAGDWYSINGNLSVTEIHDIAYDSLSNTIISGNQDTGTTYQPTQGAAQWNSLSVADGGDVAVDNATLAASSRSIRYSSFQNLGAFRRTTWDANGNLVGVAFPQLTGFFGSAQFVTPLELNRIDPTRLVIGGSQRVNESLDQGENVTSLTPDIRARALAYGGVASGVDNADVLWVAGTDLSTGLPAVMVRTSFSTVLATTAYSGAGPVDIVMDPDDWRTAYVIDANGNLWGTTDTGATFQDVTGTLSDVGALRSLEYFAGGSGDYLLVGADAGVFIASLSDLSTGAFNSWKEIGGNLPNAPVYDMTYNAIDDVLVAGTLGRGAWTITKFSQILDRIVIAPVLFPLLGGN